MKHDLISAQPIVIRYESHSTSDTKVHSSNSQNSSLIAVFGIQLSNRQLKQSTAET